MILYPFLRWIYAHKLLLNALAILIIALYFFFNYNNAFLPEIIQKLGDRMFIYWLPYVFIGIALARNEIIQLPIAFSLFDSMPSQLNFYFLNHLNSYPSPYVTATVLFTSILFTVSLIQKNIKIRSHRIKNIVRYIGQNTLTIFVANPLVILFLNSLDTK